MNRKQFLAMRREPWRPTSSGSSSLGTSLALTFCLGMGLVSGSALPITSFTWLYLRKADALQAHAADDFLGWMFTEGQQYVAEEGYVELPDPLLAAVRSRVKSLR